MWTKPKTDIKCPRGDCVYYSTPRNDAPCSCCTCCNSSNAMSKSFNYVSATMWEYQNANTCVCCGAVVPEGTQLCHKCQKGD